MLIKLNRASLVQDDPKSPPCEGAVYDLTRRHWTLRISTMDELVLLCRRLQEALLFDLDPTTLTLTATIFDVFPDLGLTPFEPSVDEEEDLEGQQV